jgi:peptide deformylase
MAIRKIARMGNPVLNWVAAKVADPGDPEIARLAGDMKETLVDIGGSGLAAPQVFESVRVVVYRLSPRLLEGVEETADPWVVMVNPVVTAVTDEVELGWERCLSIPGLHGKVPRYQRVRVTYQTLSGEDVSNDGEGVYAVLLQHECDHLDGVLYPMRMTDLSMLEFNAEPGRLASDLSNGETVWPSLRQLVDETRTDFGFCILIDCHSMPSHGVAVNGHKVASDLDVILGDGHGQSCASAVIDCVEASLTAMGYRVGRNDPYSGGFVTRHYGRPSEGVHALQIEISRKLYMDEARIERSPELQGLKKDMRHVILALAKCAGQGLVP